MTTLRRMQVAKRDETLGRTGPTGRGFATLVLGIALLAATTAGAQDFGEKVQVHGFGGWAYAQTNGNAYLIGTEQGNYDNLSMALNASGTLSDKLTVVSQFELRQRPGFESLETRLDFAFAQWRFSDALKLRVGRVKHPFGLYGETFNVGTLRPLYMLPQSIYGPERFTANSVDGLGLTGSHDIRGWGVTYDVYGGRIDGKFRIIGTGQEEEDVRLGLYEASFGFDEVFGARLSVQPPVDGLAVGVSSYHGLGRGYFGNGPETALVAHAEYAKGQGQLRAEWGTTFGNDISRYDAFYIEGAYKVWGGLQLAARYDGWEGHVKNREMYELLMPYILKVQDSHDFTLGVNYWFSPELVVRGEYHWVRGNRFAAPNDFDVLSAFPTTNEIRRDTGMFVIGAHFSF